MKRCVITILLLFISPIAWADTLTLSGTLTGLPKENVTYDFTITSTFVNLFGGEVDDTISGLATLTAKNGMLLSTEFFDPSNLFVFQAAGDQITLAEFADFKPDLSPYDPRVLLAKYDFQATGLNQVQIVFTHGSDPQVVGMVGTPEPAAWLMLVAGLLVLVGVGVLMSRVLRRARQADEAMVEPPIILTSYGPVTEGARRQAAMNMLEDPDLRGQVFQVVLRECGGDDAKAAVEFARRYPELYGKRVDYKA